MFVAKCGRCYLWKRVIDFYNSLNVWVMILVMLIVIIFCCNKECDVLQSTYSQVTDALARAGLESSNLIVGIDFTKSNEWTGLTLIVHIQTSFFLFLFPSCINLLTFLNFRCKVIQQEKPASHWRWAKSLWASNIYHWKNIIFLWWG